VVIRGYCHNDQAESLPEAVHDLAVEHLRVYLEGLQDEMHGEKRRKEGELCHRQYFSRC